MNTNNRNIDDQEIDLAQISKKISSLFESINFGIYKSIRFLIKNIVVIGALFFIGLGLGFYIDKNTNVYDNEIIVQPNFGTTDYLYSKIELLASKIKNQDTLFLKSIGITKPSEIKSIKIKPVVDVYKFITGNDKDRNEQNFELLKLMAEDGDMKKIVEENTTSKNYAYHKISFVTNALSKRENIIEPLLKYLNNSKYFNQIKMVYIQNEKNKILKNNEIIAQIDLFLNGLNQDGSDKKSDKLVYYNENTQLNDVIQTKNGLIAENGRLLLDMVTINNIINENSYSMNKKDTKYINGKLKLILPVLFVFLYLFAHFFISFYKKQTLKYNQMS
ncbi:hypothetical protein G4D82_02820 [Flavobacterium sp. CYK-4]|uniref:hypothetical protein n=1 Tax=Flavobacterium lotistagni TaxID=2709660 RepID=UPI00140959B4|nr:hypothetical protein [Flavobacterium lotistagni]NHM06141.1 hypothetical protein [Flavobacterium lotistagni]